MATLSARDALGMAHAALKDGDVLKAEHLSRAILGAIPTELQAFDLLAQILMGGGRQAEAIQEAKRIVGAMSARLATSSVQYGLNVLRTLGFKPSGILDVGAHQGKWAQMAHELYPDAHILMIEAQPELQAALTSVRDLDPSRMDFRIALVGSDNRAAVQFFKTGTDITTGSSIYEEQTTYPRSILHLPMRRLDDVVRETLVSEYQILKLDVQGAELEVLNGAVKTLQGIEVLVMELSIVEYNKGAPLFAETIERTNELGFRVFDLYPLLRNSRGALIQLDCIFLRNTSSLWPAPPFL